MYKFHYNNKEFDFDEPKVMAIINLTPDSFYDGGKYLHHSLLLKDVEEKINSGAYILDLGAQSTRPGAEMISAEEEWNRLRPALTEIRKHFNDVIISVDTFHGATAQRALDSGADMINDVSGLKWDASLRDVILKFRCPYVLMHSKGTPEVMQSECEYRDVVQEVKNYFISAVKNLKAMGIENIIIDPGFGFAKNISQNFSLLRNFHIFTQMGYPVLAGVSRKSMIYKTLGTHPMGALNGTTVLNTLALEQGARILRVHDVKEAMEAIQLWKAYASA
ncbi:MAG: dihydropteroate synthase [Bacteroidia bacterium]|nr:dihydropteroate synthase [Bacteroidia bacterium]